MNTINRVLHRKQILKKHLLVSESYCALAVVLFIYVTRLTKRDQMRYVRFSIVTSYSLQRHIIKTSTCWQDKCILMNQ